MWNTARTPFYYKYSLVCLKLLTLFHSFTLFVFFLKKCWKLAVMLSLFCSREQPHNCQFSTFDLFPPSSYSIQTGHLLNSAHKRWSCVIIFLSCVTNRYLTSQSNSETFLQESKLFHTIEIKTKWTFNKVLFKKKIYWNKFLLLLQAFLPISKQKTPIKSSLHSELTWSVVNRILLPSASNTN